MSVDDDVLHYKEHQLTTFSDHSQRQVNIWLLTESEVFPVQEKCPSGLVLRWGSKN